MDRIIKVNGIDYKIIRLLGHGKGGYSYLALSGDKEVVLKQIHHEPCDYYSFGDKLEAEKNDYKRLKKIGIRIPELIDIDDDQEIIIKEYIKGPTVYELIEKGISVKPYLDQVREMADIAKSSGLNIDYYPTNFIVNKDLIWYIDYECNEYMDKWSFENWGISHWIKTEV